MAATLEDPESLLRNPGSSVERFRNRLRRMHDRRHADSPAAPLENADVEVEEPHTASQPPPQELQGREHPESNTLLESLAPRLTDWLSQELVERIPAGVEAHFGARRHALVEDIASESAHRAVDALLDSDPFLEVISDVIRAEVRSQTAKLLPAAAFQSY